MNALEKKQIRRIQKVSQGHKVKELYVFGSVCSDEFSEESDVDFVVIFDKNIPIAEFAGNFFELLHNLEIIIGRKVDLVTEKSIKNPYFAESVNRTKEKIYDRENKEVSV